MKKAFRVNVKPDWQGLVDCILRKGTPKRVHFIELFLDGEVKEAIERRFGVGAKLKKDDLFLWGCEREVAIQRYLGYDFVGCRLENMNWPVKRSTTQDTAELQRGAGRTFIDEGKGMITNWEEFEKYPWPDPAKAESRAFEWFQKNLPDDMCVIARGGFGHFCEHLSWIMGYETLCYALHDNRPLVKAMYDKLLDSYVVMLKRILQFDRVKVVWGSDDMGFKNGTLIGPADMREFVLSGHKIMARMAHDAGRPYILHSCGNLSAIIDDLVHDVRIDGKHSYEDTIEDVTVLKDGYGREIALLGGIDVDFLCRSDEQAVRRRVRKTLDKCHPGGGYCLGSGNSVANYVPVDNYLAMLDEGRNYGG